MGEDLDENLGHLIESQMLWWIGEGKELLTAAVTDFIVKERVSIASVARFDAEADRMINLFLMLSL